MIFVVSLKTESGDNYQFIQDVSSEEEMLSYVKECMGDELAYVCEYMASSLEVGGAVLEELIRKEIATMQEDCFDV